MNPLKKIGIILWLMVCLFGSFVYGLIFISWYNSIKGFDDFSASDSFFIIFVLLIFSLVLSVPFLIYILIRDKLNINKKSRIKEYSIVLTVFCVLLYFIFSLEMRSFIEGFEVMTTYYILGFLSLNLYLRKREKYIVPQRNGK